MKRKLNIFVLAAALAGVLGVAAVASAAGTPAVVTGAPGHATDHTVVLHGTVDPNGAATTYYFQWGLTTAYGVTSTARSAGSGVAAKSVHVTATGLLPGTVYHYRVVATNGAGTVAGADRTFKTTGTPPPGAATGPAAVSRNGAILTGLVNPNKKATTYYFQYGTTTAYGQQTAGAALPAGTTPVAVFATLQGLEARTIFHYRVVAQSSSGPQYGGDGTFMTLPRHRPRPTIRARTRPLHAAHAPYVFTTSGSIAGPNWIPGLYDCRGNVTVKFLRGRHVVGSTLLPVQPNCTFSGQTVFTGLPGGAHTLFVRVRYAGNGYLTPRRARLETVTLG